MDTIIFLYDFQYILEESKYIKNYNKILIIDKQNKNIDTVRKFEHDFQKIIEVNNIFDVDCVENVIKDLVEKESINIHAILATFEGVVEVAGALRQRFAIRGLSEKTTNILRDKYLMKSEVKKNGILCAEIEEVNSIVAMLNFGEKYGYPFVLKPKSGFGTINTYIINNVDAVPKYKDILENSGTSFVAESFIKGEEYHCDSIVVDGDIIFCSVGKYHNNAINTVLGDKMDGTIIFPLINEDSIPSKIKEFNQRVIKALKIDTSICHLEVFVNDEEVIYFGEIGARVPGGYIGKCIINTHNINLYKAFIDIEVGNKNIEIANCTNKYTGIGVFPSAKGEIVEISSEDDYKNNKELIELKIFNKKGDKISERKSILERTGYFIVEGNSYLEVKNSINNIYNSYNLILK